MTKQRDLHELTESPRTNVHSPWVSRSAAALKRWRRTFALVVLALGILPCAFAEPALPRVLLITGLGTSDPAHPKHILSHEFYNDQIVAALQGIAEVTVTEDLSMLSRERLNGFDAVLNNSFLLEPTDAQLAAFFEFIERGGGYIALHAGLESFVNSERYIRMMGGRLAGHSPLKPFTVETFEDGFGTDRMRPSAHPIAAGIPPFETQDELYVVQTNTDELEVIARAESHPIVWWRPWRNGSVIAFTLGHAQASVQNEGYQAMLRNCVRWLTGSPLIERLPPRVFANDRGLVQDILDLNAVTHGRSGRDVQFTLVNDRPDLLAATLDERNRIDLALSPHAHGVARLTVQARTANGRTDSQTLNITVEPRGTGNLARYDEVKVHTSSNEPRYLTADPALVIDGDPDTRWSSNYVDPSWIALDLGQPYLIERVSFIWQGAYAARYELQVSADGQTWHTVERRRGREGPEEVKIAPREGRFVRMLGTQRATRYGYSLHEFQVFGKPVGRGTGNVPSS